MRLRASMATALSVVALSSCGSAPATSPTAAPSATASPAPRPSAAAGPCASVTTTTAIESVPAACAALWAPYGVTKVPPANLTDSTPTPRAVINATNGAVSDADATSWASAANRTGIWLRWSEANAQYGLTQRIEAGQVINAQFNELMRRGTTLAEPDCDLFAGKYSLFPLTPADTRFFASFGQAVADQYVLVESYPGPCAIISTNTQGVSQTLIATASAVTSLSAGTVHHDLLLGDIWYGDGVAFCTSRGAPSTWCAA
jgi:hypothetical protein